MAECKKGRGMLLFFGHSGARPWGASVLCRLMDSGLALSRAPE
jgi:hypothetical protein